MENKKKIKVALVRGDSLNAWEGGMWSDLGSEIEVEGFCSKKNLYPITDLKFPVNILRSSTDCRLQNFYYQYLKGKYQQLFGLEKKLSSFDIVHTAEISYYFTLQAVNAKKSNPNLKVVTTVWDNSFGRFEHDYPFLGKPPVFWKNKIYKIIKENAAGVDLFLPVTNYSAELLREYGVPDKKIKILTPAVQKNKIKYANNFKFDGDVYLMVNRLVKEKGVYEVVYGWKAYLRDIKQKEKKKLVIIGSGKEKRCLEELVVSLGLKENVIFAGKMLNSEVRSLYTDAKALILGSLVTPLWQEQFGYVLAEAVTAGCPVVCTFSGAIPEVVGKAGLFFSPGNPLELKDRLKDLDNPEIYLTLKKNCEEVGSKFEYEKFKRSLSEIYRDL